MATEQTNQEVIGIDIDGESVQLPKEIAKKVLNYRDKIKNEMQTIKKDLTNFITEKDALEKAKTEAEQQLKLEGLAKEKRFKELELEVSKKYTDEIQSLKNHVIDREIDSVLLSSESFDKQFKDDVKLLIKTQHKLDHKDGKIVENDVELSSIVSKFLEGKPQYLVNKGPRPSGAKPTVIKQSKTTQDLISSGLSKVIK